MKDVVIFGAGDFARIAKVTLEQDSPYRIAAFTVHKRYLTSDRFEGLTVTPFEDLASTHPSSSYALCVAIGFSRMNRARAEIYERVKEAGYEVITYVSSKAMLVGTVEIGEGCFIFEGNVLQPGVRIGKDVVLWSANHIGHDAVIGDHCFLASHVVVSGRATIGARCFVGVNATIRDQVNVADDCLIGAGALIMKDTAPGEVYAVRGTSAAAIKSWDLKDF